MTTRSQDFGTVAATIVTPMRRDRSVDFNQLRVLTQDLVERGIRVVVSCGNTGEFSSLSLDEAKRVTRTVVAAAEGGAAVVAGVGWSMPIAEDLTRDAYDAGANAVMIHHPVHTYIDRDALLKYYEGIATCSDLGIFVYKRGPEISDALILELIDSQPVLAVKYAVNDVAAFADLVSKSRKGRQVAWLCGTAESWAPFFHLAGASGFSSGLANFAPEQSLAMFQALREENWQTAMQLRSSFASFEMLRQGRHGANNVSCVKEALAILGMAARTVREPLAVLRPSERAEVRSVVNHWGLL